MQRGGGDVLQWGRNNFLVSSAVTKDEERKRTGLSQSFLDTRRSFSLSCEKLPDNGPRQTERPSDPYGIKGVSHTYVQKAPAACVCALVPTKPPCSSLLLLAPPYYSSIENLNGKTKSLHRPFRRNDCAVRRFALCYAKPTLVYFVARKCQLI